MIRLSFNASDARVVAVLRTKGSLLIEKLAQKLTAQMIRLQSKVQHEKLSGQVLHQRTGVLMGSVEAHPAEVEASKIIASVTAAGGPAWYGRVHEEGGTHAYEIATVNKKALHFLIGGKDIFVKHVLHPPLPQRAFMRPTAEEMREEIVAGLQETIMGVMRSGSV